MYDVSDLWLDVCRFGGGHKYGYVQAYQGGDLVTLPDGATRLPLKLDGSNEVQVDGATSGVRRALRSTLPKDEALWDALAPVGTELRAYTAIKYQSGATEVVPQGVFDVDVQSMGYGPSGDLSITAPDRWARIQRAEFLTPRTAAAGTSIPTLIGTLITEVVGGSASIETSSAATLPSGQTWDRNRAGAIEELAKAAGLDVFFDRSGTPIIRDIPTLQSSGAWTVDAGPEGVMIAADRQRDRQRTYNIVVVTSSRNDGVEPFAPQYVWDNNADSPTYAGSGSGASATPPSAGSAGPFGQRPFFYDSPLLANTTQARAAGASILAKVTGRAAQLTLSAAPNPALDDGDTILVTFPRDRWDRQRASERHIVDSMTVPLVWHRNPLRISTRSTVADLPES